MLTNEQQSISKSKTWPMNQCGSREEGEVQGDYLSNKYPILTMLKTMKNELRGERKFRQKSEIENFKNAKSEMNLLCFHLFSCKFSWFLTHEKVLTRNKQKSKINRKIF